jgi:threonine/homoserine/homoserine lactone efflux protein
MDPLLAVAGLVAVAAITPGPNNFVVMRAAASSGIAGALPAIAGVVFGSLALLALVAAGAGALFSVFPASRLVIAFGGGGYLAWMGGRMVLLTMKRASAEEAPAVPPPRVGGVA